MQNPDEDTDWNAVLRQKGILPQKPKEKEITEEDIVNLVESTISDKQSTEKKLETLTLDELEELEDEEDERVLLEYRNKRLAEMKAALAKGRFGDVREISAEDYIQQVNKAGDGVWVVLHLYKQGIPLCTLLNQYLDQLARKFPAVKFLKSISSTCIPNYPDKNLPTIFVYFESDLKSRLIGPHEFRGMNLKQDELEWILAETGAIKTSLEADPRPKIKDVMFEKLKGNNSDDENDW